MAAPVASPDRSAAARAAAESRQALEALAPPDAPLAGFSGTRRVPPPVNEPVKSYAPGSPEKLALKARLASMAKERVDIPIIIDGREIRADETAQSVMPHDHAHVLADWHKATPAHVQQAIEAAKRAGADWANWAWEDRAAVFLRAAELLTTTWRQTINAATMLNQSKTAYQAEIDSACELIDFISNNTMWNQLDYRPLEGFVYAVTPFNFTSIAGNLPTAPALMGNAVVWKPAASAMLSAYYLMKLLEEAGLPPGVINLVPGDAAQISDVALSHRDLAGVHFTGSTAVFNGMWKVIGARMGSYANYPRIVGETGGKDFIVAHPSADPQALAVAIARGGFEYQGQKCSAASRIYVPRSLWKEVRERTVGMIDEMKVGDVTDFRNFMGAVIDRKAFDKISGYIEDAKSNASIVAGGQYDGRDGYFVHPTLVETDDPRYRLLCEEIFGPVVTVHVYDDARWTETLRIIDTTTAYALTGAVFANDRRAVREAQMALRNAAGNFYVNDKPTGAVVGQQPFGGARGSGTNDKAGSKLNLVRWVNARSIKETFSPPTDYKYPFMAER